MLMFGTSRGGRRRRLMAAAVVTAAVTLPVAAAEAGVEQYWYGNVGSGSVIGGPQHSMNSNRVGNVYGASAGVGSAASSGGSLYGNWILGTGYACHPYGGSNVITPLLLNNYGGTQAMYGYDYFGVDRYC